MERIEQSQFYADPASALERARANGETLEIVAGGKTIARLVPEPEAAKVAAWLPGGSKGKMWFVDPNDTLDELWTPEDISEWENSDPMGN